MDRLRSFQPEAVEARSLFLLLPDLSLCHAPCHVPCPTAVKMTGPLPKATIHVCNNEQDAAYLLYFSVDLPHEN